MSGGTHNSVRPPAPAAPVYQERKLWRTEGPRPFAFFPSWQFFDILAFYADPGAPFATKKNMNAWQNVLLELDKLKALPVAAVSN